MALTARVSRTKPTEAAFNRGFAEEQRSHDCLRLLMTGLNLESSMVRCIRSCH